MNNRNSKTNEKKFLKAIIKSSPLWLLLALVLSFAIMLVLQVAYYEEIVLVDKVVKPLNVILAIAFAVMSQVLRFALVLASLHDFSNNKGIAGIFGMLASIGATIFATHEVLQMVEIWGGTMTKSSFESMLLFVVWVGLGLEIRVVMNVYKKPQKQPNNESLFLDNIQGENIAPNTRRTAGFNQPLNEVKKNA